MKHGTSASYKNGCRCEGCTKAHAIHMRAYLREWRKKHPEYKKKKQREYRKAGKDNWLNGLRAYSQWRKDKGIWGMQ